MFYLGNRFNQNLYRYISSEDRSKYQNIMDEAGYEVYREWEANNVNGKTNFYCEYKEVGKA